jgi:signal transduction histidine kinase
MPSKVTNERPVFLATALAGSREVRIALAVVLVSVVMFLAIAPFAKTPLAPMLAFLPIYLSALVICDLITAVLLFGQFDVLGSRAILVLATGYLISAFLAVSHLLLFPGVFAPNGLFGAGAQGAAWIYISWHAILPFVVIAYTRLKKKEKSDDIGTRGEPRRRARIAILCSIASALAVTFGLTLLATTWVELLPSIIKDNRITDMGHIAIWSVWVFSLLALLVLWRRSPHTVIDLWLMVVMCAWLIDITLAAILNVGRYDLGWYGGRIYGLFASSLLLILLLLENGIHYARLAQVSLELRAANAALARFLSTMSHELRTPLNAILGFTGTLLMKLPGPLNTDQETQLKTVQTSAKHLLALVNDLLDVGKIEAGKMELHIESIRCRELLEAVLSTLRLLAEKKGLELKVVLPEEDLVLQTDRRALNQIMLNLANNAIKFTEMGMVRVTLSRGAKEKTIEFSVADTGIGISAEDQAQLFAAFTQIDSPSHPRQEGTGLGLHLSQKLAEALGGRILLHSEYGKGSTFTLVLPEQ